MTLVLLTAGVLLLPIIGPLVGLAMLWEAKTWALPEKLLGTLLPFATGALVAMVILPAGSPPRGFTLVWHLALVGVVATAVLYTVVRLVRRRRV